VYFDPRGSRFAAIFLAGAVIVCCAAAVGNCRAADASASPEQLITGFANAPNINAAFYDLNEACIRHGFGVQVPPPAPKQDDLHPAIQLGAIAAAGYYGSGRKG